MSCHIAAMGQEAFVPERPQMRVNRGQAFLATKMHRDAPAALKAFFEQRRQRVLEPGFSQMIEQNLGHTASPQPS